MLQELLRWPQKLEQGVELAQQAIKAHGELLLAPYKKIAFVGMGGSGIAGRIFKTILDRHATITTIVVDSPTVPLNIDHETLTFVTSYSGNTWESLDAFATLVKRKVPLVAISHGGTLQAYAQKCNVPHITLPTALQPRTALGLFMGFFWQLFQARGVVGIEKLMNEWMHTAQALLPQYSEEQAFATMLPLLKDLDMFHVWGVSDDSASAAYRSTTQFNENAKIQAVCSVFPELAHNLLVGLEQVSRRPVVLWYQTMFQAENMNRAIQSLHGILCDSGVDLYKVPVFGDTFGSQFFSMILWTDFASFYLGHQRGVDTQRVRIIEELKQRQQSSGIFVEV